MSPDKRANQSDKRNIITSVLKVHFVAVWTAPTETKSKNNSDKTHFKNSFKFGERRMFSQKNPNVIFVQYIT